MNGVKGRLTDQDKDTKEDRYVETCEVDVLHISTLNPEVDWTSLGYRSRIESQKSCREKV
jgi:hypothetical protein